MRIRSTSLVPLMIVAATAATMASRALGADYSHYVSPWKTPFTYQGPRGAAHWSSLDPAYETCNTGKAQSPIDIRDARKTHLPQLRFEYRSEPARYVINNRW